MNGNISCGISIQLCTTQQHKGLPQWLSSKESACGAENSGSIPGLGRIPGGGHGNSLQYFCLENPMERGA